MATDYELSVLLSLRDEMTVKFNQIINNIKSQMDKTSDATGKTEKSVSQAVLSFLGLSGGTKAIVSIFGQLIPGLSLVAGGTVLLKAVTVDAMRSFMEEESAVSKLTMAMINMNSYSDEAISKMKLFSEELQKTSTVANEVTLSMMSLLKTFGMTDEQIFESIEAAADFSAIMGYDIRTAVMMLGRAFQGHTSMLVKYGIVINDTLGPSEKFNAVIKEMNEQFGGAAQAELNTYAGGIKSLANEIKSVLKPIGELLLSIAFGPPTEFKTGFWLEQFKNRVAEIKKMYKPVTAIGIELEPEASLASVKTRAAVELAIEEERKLVLKLEEAWLKERKAMGLPDPAIVKQARNRIEEESRKMYIEINKLRMSDKDKELADLEERVLQHAKAGADGVAQAKSTTDGKALIDAKYAITYADSLRANLQKYYEIIGEEKEAMKRRHEIEKIAAAKANKDLTVLDKIHIEDKKELQRKYSNVVTNAYIEDFFAYEKFLDSEEMSLIDHNISMARLREADYAEFKAQIEKERAAVLIKYRNFEKESKVHSEAMGRFDEETIAKTAIFESQQSLKREEADDRYRQILQDQQELIRSNQIQYFQILGEEEEATKLRHQNELDVLGKRYEKEEYLTRTQAAELTSILVRQGIELGIARRTMAREREDIEIEYAARSKMIGVIGYEAEIKQLDLSLEAQRVRWQRLAEDKPKYTELANRMIELAEKEHAEKLLEYSDSFVDGMMRGFKEIDKSQKSLYNEGKELVKTVSNEMTQSFSTLFFDVFTGQLKTAEDYFKNFTDSILRFYSNMLAKMVAEQAMAGLKGGFSGLLGLLGISTAVPDLDTLGDFELGDIALPHKGGLIMHRGGEVPAILEKGEYVIKKEAVTSSTLPILRNINARSFHDGGYTDENNLETREQGPVNITIQAVDADSFVALLARNKNALAPLITQLYRQNTEVRKVFRGG